MSLLFPNIISRREKFSYTWDQLGKLEGVHWLRISMNLLFDNNFFLSRRKKKYLKTHFRLKWDPKSLFICHVLQQANCEKCYFILFYLFLEKFLTENVYFYFWPNDLIHLLLYTFVSYTLRLNVGRLDHLIYHFSLLNVQIIHNP